MNGSLPTHLKQKVVAEPGKYKVRCCICLDLTGESSLARSYLFWLSSLTEHRSIKQHCLTVFFPEKRLTLKFTCTFVLIFAMPEVQLTSSTCSALGMLCCITTFCDCSVASCFPIEAIHGVMVSSRLLHVVVRAVAVSLPSSSPPGDKHQLCRVCMLTRLD